jgi:hypothetical protein
MWTELDLHIRADHEIILKFKILVENLLELGKNLGICKYEMTTKVGDKISIQGGDPDDDIVEVQEPELIKIAPVKVTPKPEIQHGGPRNLVILTSELKEYIRHLSVDLKWNRHKVGLEVGIADDTVRRVLKGFGLTQPVRAPIGEVQIEAIKKMFVEEEISLSAIARRTGYSKTTITKHLVRLGLFTPMTVEQHNKNQVGQIRMLRAVK